MLAVGVFLYDVKEALLLRFAVGPIVFESAHLMSFET